MKKKLNDFDEMIPFNVIVEEFGIERQKLTDIIVEKDFSFPTLKNYLTGEFFYTKDDYEKLKTEMQAVSITKEEFLESIENKGIKSFVTTDGEKINFFSTENKGTKKRGRPAGTKTSKKVVKKGTGRRGRPPKNPQ